MTTAIALDTQWDPNSGLPMPAYLSEALGELGSNIADRQNVPSLSYEGKTWTIVKDGNKTKLQAQNSDGDMVPIPVMRLVLLSFNADRGRSFYEGTYNPATAAAPKCWSPDGKAPDASVKEKQAALCTGCPQSVKGSKVQDGKEMVACSSHRMIAIAPGNDLTADPLRLKIAVTSDYDKEVVEHGWYAFRQYTDWLKSRGVSHTGLVVTKVKFDSNVAYPKLLFALDRLLTAEEVGLVKTTLNNPKVAELLAEKWSAAGTAGTLTNDADIKPFGLEGAYADGWIAHPDSAGWSYKGSEVIANEELSARYLEPVAEIPAIPASEQVIENKPAVPVVHDPIANAEASGWVKHPEAPDYHYKGEEVVLTTDLAARFPAPAPVAAAPVVPAAPVTPPAPVVVKKTPLELMEADGWVVHPEAPTYHYKGEEVVLSDTLVERYAGNASTTGTASTQSAADTVTSTASTVSLSEVPADVQNLLDKWSGG